jgi:hypothetical protein
LSTALGSSDQTKSPSSAVSQLKITIHNSLAALANHFCNRIAALNVSFSIHPPKLLISKTFE